MDRKVKTYLFDILALDVINLNFPILKEEVKKVLEEK